jgi:hypothetical protein
MQCQPGVAQLNLFFFRGGVLKGYRASDIWTFQAALISGKHRVSFQFARKSQWGSGINSMEYFAGLWHRAC